MPRPASASVWLRAVVVELAGAVVAAALTVIALRHVMLTDRVRLLWYDGDSVLLTLVERSIRLGQPFEWAMSPTLFFFPEIPVYVLCAAVTGTPQQALALNGVLVLLGVYAILRWITAELMPAASRSRRVTVAVSAMAALTLLMLTESSASVANLELASLLLLTTYYYGAVLATLATAALVLRVVRHASAETPSLGTGALVVLAGLAAATTMSDPLYVPWAAGPAIITLVGLALFRRVPARAAGAISIVLAGGALVGWLARIPLQRFVSLEPSSYILPSNAQATLRYFATITDTMAGTGEGDIELLLLLVGLLVGVGGTVWAWRRRNSRTVLVACTMSVVTTVVLCVGVIVSGSETPRYLQPIVVLPLVAFVAVAELFRTRVQPTRIRTRYRAANVAVAVVGVGVLAAGVAAAPWTLRDVVTAQYGNVACLDRWVANRNVEGVGQFWTVRPLMAYGSRKVRLLQVRDNMQIYPWLVNLASYESADPSYVIVGAGDVWSTSVEDQLGEPADIVQCTGYDIFNYAGTAGAKKLSSLVSTSAGFVRLERGFRG